MKQNAGMALFGISIASVSFITLILSTIGIASTSALAAIWPSFAVNAPIFLVLIGLSLVGYIYGIRMFFSNITPIAYTVIGLMGLGLFLFGVMIALAGVATLEAGVGIVILFADILVFSLGLAFMEIGWKISNIKVFKAFSSLLKGLASVVKVGA